MKACRIILLLIIIFQTCPAEAQVKGCTDPIAVNYNPLAVINDGSCKYNPAVTAPVSGYILAPVLGETSGLIFWNEHLWTHNDNIDTNIYRLDTLNGLISDKYPLSGITNEDWEEISQDASYVYIGDFGNNSGNRENLKIFKISKNSLLQRSPVIDSIKFSYSDQTDFNSPGGYNTDYDCEAFIVASDSIYLFTKQWVSQKTGLYSLPKKTGTFTARKRGTLDTEGLITGATFLEVKRLVVLSGYSKGLKPFIYLLYDFRNSDFFGGNKRKIELDIPYNQVEGIATQDGVKYYLTNEFISPNAFSSIKQKLHILDLRPFLGNYLDLPAREPDDENNFIVSPVPAHDYLKVRSLSEVLPVDYNLITISGQVVMAGRITQENSILNISGVNEGIYFLRIGDGKKNSFKVIKN